MEILIVLSGLVNIALGIICLRNSPKNIVNQTFALFSFSTGLWIISSSALKMYPSFLTGFIVLSLGMCLSISFILFIKEYPVSDAKGTLTFYLPLILVIILVAIGFFTKTFLTDVVIKDGVATPVFGPMFFVIQIIMYPYLIYGFIKLLKKYRKAVYTEKLKMRYLIVILIGFIFCIASMNGILPAMGIYNFVDLGTTSAVVWSYLIFYAISKSTLFSIRYIVGNSLFVLFKIVIIMLTVYVFMHIEGKYLGGITSNTSITLNIFIVLYNVMFFSRISSKFLEFLSKYVINTNYNPVLLTNKFREKISKELVLDKIIATFVETIRKSIVPLGYCVIIFEPGELKILYKKLVSFEEEILEKFKEIFIKEGIPWSIINRETLKVKYQENTKSHENSAILKCMQDNNIALIYPLVIKRQVRGLIYFKDMDLNRSYTTESIKFLDDIIMSMTLSIERSVLYTELEELNANLKDRIELATKELIGKYAELDETYRKEKDMLDILGHELRTPLSIARNAVDFLMVLKDEKKLTDEKLKQYLNISKENLYREVKLLETMLSTTKIDNRKLNLDLVKVDLIEVVNDSLEGLKTRAKGKGLQIECNYPKEAMVVADRTRIQEITDNLIDNAIKYTDKGKIMITIVKEKNIFKLSIADTGIGIPQKEIENLGKKFYRVNNYLSEDKNLNIDIIRPGGTGLGLYVTFGLVKAMGGTVNVESEVGKGSIFNVTFKEYTKENTKKVTAVIDRMEDYRARQFKEKAK